MLGRLFLLFVVVPLVELAILIQVGRWIGLWPTLALVLLTGVVGAWLARDQGFRVLAELQGQVGTGGLPGRAILDGAAILVGGALLLAPGILTDVVGFCLLLPLPRRWIQDGFLRRMRRKMEEGEVEVTVLRSRPLDESDPPGGPFPPGGGPLP